MNKKDKKRLADILPVQQNYFLLSNGEKYARFGGGKTNGLLVFETMEKAIKFCTTVGVGLPEYQPVTVDVADLLPLIEDIGAVCVAEGLNVRVGVLSGR